jgi:hypothetical protein
MKTTKAILSAIIFLITSVAIGQSETPNDADPNNTNPPSISIYLKTALQDRGLVYAMRTQLNPAFLQVEKPFYSVPIKYQRRIVNIVGPAEEWNRFFNIHGDSHPQYNDKNRFSLKEALTDARLVRAMHEQLTPALIREDKPIYTAKVRYNRTTVFVYASRNAWKWFFQSALTAGSGGA